jgi:hypothetical protein
MKTILPFNLLIPIALHASMSASVEFTRDIHPLLAARCVARHGPQKNSLV